MCLLTGCKEYLAFERVHGKVRCIIIMSMMLSGGLGDVSPQTSGTLPLSLPSKANSRYFSFPNIALSFSPVSSIMCVRACVRDCVRACVRACVRVCVRACILHIVLLEPLIMCTFCVSFCQVQLEPALI